MGNNKFENEVTNELGRSNKYLEKLINLSRSAKDSEKLLIRQEILGYAAGLLANTELANYEQVSGREMNFVHKSNREVFADSLVRAKYYLQEIKYLRPDVNVADDMGVTTSAYVPYKTQLDAIKVLKIDGKTAEDMLKPDASAAAKADLERLNGLISSLDNLKTAAEYFYAVQEAVNILESMISSGETANMPLALSQLLELLALKTDLVTKTVVEKANDGLTNMTANIRAVLASA
jgi:hypothetical protein